MSKADNTSVWAFIQAVGSHWTTLMSGGVVTVALGVFERFSGRNVPLWVYGLVLVLFALMACYLAWRDSQKEHGAGSDISRQRRNMIADRLAQLIKESPPVLPPSFAVQGAMDGLAEVGRIKGHRSRIIDFLEVHCGPEAVTRFEKHGTVGLEQLLAEMLREDDKTKPWIKGEIEEVIVETALPEEKIAGFDYYMTMRFWLRSETVPTNFRAFELWLFVEHAKLSQYKGERILLDGLCLDRKQYQKTNAQTEPAIILTKLVDYDAATPLEQWVTREGWLRFVIRNVEYADKGTEGLKFDRLELRVTDGSGKLWTLTTKPPWTKTGPKLEIKSCPSPEDFVKLGVGSRMRFKPFSGQR